MAEKRALNPSGASSAREHRHVGRQRRVERLGRPRGRRAARHLDARDLPGRVDARVGAPGDGEPVPAARIDRVERLAERRPRPCAGRAAAPSRETRRRRTRASASAIATAAGSTTRSRSPVRLDVEHEPVTALTTTGAPGSIGSAERGAPDLALDPDLARRLAASGSRRPSATPVRPTSVSAPTATGRAAGAAGATTRRTLPSRRCRRSQRRSRARRSTARRGTGAR